MDSYTFGLLGLIFIFGNALFWAIYFVIRAIQRKINGG